MTTFGLTSMALKLEDFLNGVLLVMGVFYLGTFLTFTVLTGYNAAYPFASKTTLFVTLYALVVACGLVLVQSAVEYGLYASGWATDISYFDIFRRGKNGNYCSDRFMMFFANVFAAAVISLSVYELSVADYTKVPKHLPMVLSILGLIACALRYITTLINVNVTEGPSCWQATLKIAFLQCGRKRDAAKTEEQRSFVKSGSDEATDRRKGLFGTI